MIKRNYNTLAKNNIISKKDNKAENRNFQNTNKIGVGAICFIADYS